MAEQPDYVTSGFQIDRRRTVPVPIRSGGILQNRQQPRKRVAQRSACQRRLNVVAADLNLLAANEVRFETDCLAHIRDQTQRHSNSSSASSVRLPKKIRFFMSRSSANLAQTSSFTGDSSTAKESVSRITDIPVSLGSRTCVTRDAIPARSSFKTIRTTELFKSPVVKVSGMAGVAVRYRSRGRIGRCSLRPDRDLRTLTRSA